MILKAGQHLLHLLDEVLDISRIEAGQLSLSLEAAPVAEVVADALDLVRPLASARSLHLAPEPAISASQCVLADHQRLRQVLLNLLSNAVKYNRPGGAVTTAVQLGPRRAAADQRHRHRPRHQPACPGQVVHSLRAPRRGPGRHRGHRSGAGPLRHLIQTMGGATGVTSAPARAAPSAPAACHRAGGLPGSHRTRRRRDQPRLHRPEPCCMSRT